jgi:hypothetical protein
MSDRWVFLTAFLTVVMIVASAFAIPQMFPLELLKCTIFFVIVILVFFGEDKFSYMLGIVAPPLWFILDILLGGFFHDFGTLWASMTGKPLGRSETPLYALATLSEIALVTLSIRVWRKQVSEKFLGKTFGICLVISLIYIGLIAGWYFHTSSTGAAR